MPHTSRLISLRNVHLLPFLAVASYSLFVMLGWWTGQVAWVQPIRGDSPLVANAAFSLFLLGITPLLLALHYRKTARAIALLAMLFAGLPLVESVTGLKFRLDNLLVNHESLLAGTAGGHLPTCLGILLSVAAALILRSTWNPRPRRLSLLLALTGSLACAYGATVLLASQVGLDRLEIWQVHAHLGIPTAITIFVLGCSLFLLATPRPEGKERPTGPRWLWLPAVVAGVTVSLLFWVSLKEREIAYVNHTTQLTINHIATLYSSETETQIDNLRGMAARWAEVGGTPQSLWEKDARAQFEAFPSYQVISWVDARFHTVWFWPAKGNEDAASLDHSGDPLRRSALTAARDTFAFSVAAPLQSPLRPPGFAIYTAALRGGQLDGYLVGQLDYARLLGLIDRRLNISQRYRLEVFAAPVVGGSTADGIRVYASASVDDLADGSLLQVTTFNLFNQRLTVSLIPRTVFANAERQSLPRLALFSGLGVSLLIGLVIYLAQKARTRQHVAEEAAAELLAENEERRRVEAALYSSQASARLLTHVASRTENIVFITTATGQIQWTNDSFTRCTGQSLAEITNASLLDLVTPPATSPHALEQIAHALDHYESLTTEVMIRAKDTDRRFHLRFELQPVKNDHGVTENFIAMGTDITTSVQTEATLRHAKAEADAASRAKTEFLATVSHEIRTPMNGVIGMTSLLFDTPLNPEQREFVGTIRTSGQALLGIINEILDFSKMESGHMEIEHQPIEISQCLEEAVDVYALKAAAKNIEIACHIDPAVPPWILLDMTRLRQILVNLLDNAVKFTPQGLITVEVRLTPSATGTTPPGAIPSAATKTLLIDFWIKDTGIGIAPEHRDRLFKPFSQVDSSNTRKYGGNGLGLAICQRLCQLMGGTIDMQENPGGGSIFRFCVLAEPTAAPVPTRLAPLPRAFPHAKVLVVEDLALNRVTLRQSLDLLQLKAVEASSLVEGRQVAQQHTVSAAIIDHDLAGESGLVLARELLTYQPDLPVIFLTNPQDSAKAATKEDPNLIRIPKPIRPFLIIDALHRHFTPSSVAPLPIPSASVFPAALSQPSIPSAIAMQANLAKTLPLRVLVAEDNLVNQKVAIRFLARLGYAAAVAGNGREALQALDEEKFDLVLMDMQMPEMDGLSATREIRLRYPANRQPKIFALTANAVAGDRDRCLAAGMDDYLSKPVKLESIEQLILKHFRPAQPTRDPLAGHP